MSKGNPPTATDSRDEESLTGGVKSILGRSLDQAGDLLRLFSLEAKLAVQSTLWMIIAAILLAVIVIGLWVAAQAIGVYYLQALGFSALRSTFLLFFINMLMACGLYVAIVNNLKHLDFNATLRSLSAKQSQDRLRMDKNDGL
jgi:hypothetical protein